MNRTRRQRSDSVQSPLETYLREINETPLLNADQEKELAYRIEEGDNQARDQMVRANLRLVVNIARGYAGKGLSLQDLIEEGNLGLLRAVEGFDPSMNTRFSTYASYWIKQSIKRALIKRCIRRDLAMIVTTEKDSVRMPRLPEAELKVPIYFLRVEIEILSGHESWEHCVARICKPKAMLSPERFFA